MSTIAPLLRVQNAAARLVIQLGQRDHVTQRLRELHWLPIHAQVVYKLCVLMYDIHVGNSPSYIRDIVTACRSATKRSGLRSSLTTNEPRLMWLSSKFGERAFSFAGPHVSGTNYHTNSVLFQILLILRNTTKLTFNSVLTNFSWWRLFCAVAYFIVYQRTTSSDDDDYDKRRIRKGMEPKAVLRGGQGARPLWELCPPCHPL